MGFSSVIGAFREAILYETILSWVDGWGFKQVFSVNILLIYTELI